MGGGIPQKVADNRRFFESVGIAKKQTSRRALDFGCGSGFQALALASLGFSVVGVDTSEELLLELAAQAITHPVLTIQGGMQDRGVWESHGPFDVVVCMGDSLIHLPSIEEVKKNLARVSISNSLRKVAESLRHRTIE
ncbi:MAG: methyltransferase domain-containing protein [Planctomycetaceae bacterium]